MTIAINVAAVRCAPWGAGLAPGYVTRAYLEPVSYGERGQRWRVTLAEPVGGIAGAVLIDSSPHPEFDACRALLARGITGTLETWHAGAAFPSMRLHVAKAAGLTSREGDRDGPSVVRWRPFSE